MIQSLLKNKGPLALVLGDREVTKAVISAKLELSKEDWQLLVECLKPFDVATKQMSGELYPILGSVYPLINGILTRHLGPQIPEREEVSFFEQKVKEALQRIFKVG